MDLVRLACVKRAASVHPEPGSNSPTKICPTQPTTKVIDQAKALSQKSATYRSEETSREGSRVRCVLAVLAHRIEINAKNESIVTTGRYPCLMPPGTVTPKLTGQIQQPPESDRSSARTGILSSLLFSRSLKLAALTGTWLFSVGLALVPRSCRWLLPPLSEEPSYNRRRVRTTSPSRTCSTRWCDFLPLRISRYLPWTSL